VDLSGLALLDLANLSDVKNATCRLGQVAYCFFYCFFNSMVRFVGLPAATVTDC
jgi:hypothetical protein